MKKTDRLVQLLISRIRNRMVLEAACGSADFSVSAAVFAKEVFCIDLDGSRLNHQIKPDNFHFQIMDVSKMDYPDGMFDKIVIYNSFFHIRDSWKEAEKELKRVINDNGKIYLVSTWKLDTEPLRQAYGEKAIWHDGFLIVEL